MISRPLSSLTVAIALGTASGLASDESQIVLDRDLCRGPAVEASPMTLPSRRGGCGR